MSNPVPFAAYWALTYSHGGYPLTRRISQPLGACLAFAAQRLGLGPTAVTLAGAALALGASAAYAVAPAGWTAVAALAVAYQLAYGFDCADGQLARATGATSVFGAWLDVATDYLRYVALATAVIVLLVRQHAMPALEALAAGAVLLAGSVVLLHTTGYLQRAGDGDAAAPSATRELLRVALDTPTLLLLLCLLRDFPAWLWGYALGTGAAYLAAAVTLAVLRLERPRPGGAGPP